MMFRLSCSIPMICLCLMAAGVPVQAAAMEQAGSARVAVRLLADVSSLRPGEPFKVGVLLTIDPGWHVYWKNPGDSGMATRVALELPEGFVAGPWQYPLPTLIRLPGNILNYAYEDQVMLMTTVKPPASLAGEHPSDVTLSANVKFLVCNPDVCLPGSDRAGLLLPVSAASAGGESDPLFATWEQRLPLASDPDHIDHIHSSMSPAGGSGWHVAIDVRWKQPPKQIELFPAAVNNFDVSDPTLKSSGDTTTAGFDLTAPSPQPAPGGVEAVLAYVPADGQRRGVTIMIHPNAAASAAPKSAVGVAQ